MGDIVRKMMGGKISSQPLCFGSYLKMGNFDKVLNAEKDVMQVTGGMLVSGLRELVMLDC